MNLRADIVLRRGALQVEAPLAVGAGETVALVGPNGAGKTSCLLAIAGLLRLDGGSIELGGRTLDGGPRGAFVPPEARGIGVVFQDLLLLPHLSALDNVAYGPRSRGRSRRLARAAAAAWLERVGIAADLHALRPAQLSGGQAQRTALARALATDPALLLLDEPLAAVDASARIALRRELREHLATVAGPRIVIAHDITDAVALADRIVVLEEGRVVQHGTIGDLVGCPRSRYVADLVGVNVVVGTCRTGVVAVGDVQLVVASPLEGDVTVTVHPRAISLFRDRPSGSPRNVWPTTVDALEPTLDRVRVRLGGALPLVAEVTPAAVAELQLRAGAPIWVAIKATETNVTRR